MPEVARGIELAAGHGELALGRAARSACACARSATSEAIVLPRSLKAALVPWFARVPRRTGFRGEWRYGLLNDVRKLDASGSIKRSSASSRSARERGHEACRRAARRMAAASAPSTTANLARLRRELGLDGEPLVALMPGAEYGPAKRWPAASFAALARSLAQAGRTVLVLGSAKERELGDEIRRPRGELARAQSLRPTRRSADVVDLLAAADVAVSNDSGLLHVAAARRHAGDRDLRLLVARRSRRRSRRVRRPVSRNSNAARASRATARSGICAACAKSSPATCSRPSRRARDAARAPANRP